MKSKIRRKRSKIARFRRRTRPGAPPGILIPDPGAPRGDISVIGYGAEGFEEASIERPEQVRNFLDRFAVTWVNVDGVGDVSIVRELGAIFNLHSLALEDVVHVHQRAKVEVYPEHFFVVARMPGVPESWDTEQIAIFFGRNFVLTFQERPGGDCLDAVRDRLRIGWGRTHFLRPDYLTYAIIDALVDQYFPMVEECGDRLDELEAEVSAERTAGIMPAVQAIKRNLLSIRRVMWPLRDAINALLRDTSPLISDETRPYLRDVHDHTVQIIDLVEAYRDIASGVREIHLAGVSQRTNEIMRVLTVISTIFIPLTFIAGVYGMNFDTAVSKWNMPELGWKWGYLAVMAVMAAVAVAMMAFFYRRGWLKHWGEDRRNDT
jgi:magnesium transporter